MPGAGWNPAPIEVTAPVAAPPPPPPKELGPQNWVPQRTPSPEPAPAPAPPPTPPTPPPPPPVPPNPWITTPGYSDPVGVRQADPDIVLFNTETISPELLIQLEYESISGSELINISRSDIVDGTNVIYSPIKNLSSIRRSFNPNNIIAMPATSESLFSKYPIDLIARQPSKPYFDDNGNLVIEIGNIRNDEIIEAEVDVSGTINIVDFL